MTDEVTIAGISRWIEEQVKNRNPIGMHIFLDAAQKIVALMQNFNEELIEAEIAYRKVRSDLAEGGMTAAAAEQKAKTSEEYHLFLSKKYKKDRINDLIQLIKKKASVTEWQP